MTPSLNKLEETNPSASTTPPSLLWKAYAQTLLPWLSLYKDLSSVNQAIFVASPLQPGVPGNDILPEEVTNYQQFLKSDCMQIKNQFFYSLENGSYFGTLWDYLRNVQGGKASNKLEDIRKKLTAANTAKDLAFDDVLQHYQELSQEDRKVSFIQWITKNKNNEYSKAWSKENDLEKAYEGLQDDSLDNVSRAIATMKSADDKIDYKVQSNMPCIITDKNYYMPFKTPPSPPDPATLYYRPYHILSGYRDVAQQWLSAYDPGNYSAHRTEVTLDFAMARTLKWTALGHDGFQQDASPDLSAEMLTSLSAKLSWIGLQAFDVDRGLWDVKKPRNMQLAPKAPDYLRQPFYRTTKLLLGYGVDLVFTLPSTMSAADQNTTVSQLGVSVTSKKNNEYHISLGDNAYPVLLAVLAQEV